MAQVVLENLTKVFKNSHQGEFAAVRDVTLAVEDGELLVLVGPSGCGKSTLLRMIAGLEDISEGAVWIEGVRMNEVPPKDRDIAMVFQNHALFPHMTAYENMALGLKLRKFSKVETDRRVRETAEILGLVSVLDCLPSRLSGGERQRIAVGRAIVRKPKVFLFDEPLSNLDAPMRVQMRIELSKLHSRLAWTMIYVTHDQAEAMTLGNRVAVMRQGVIQQVAEPIPLYNQPANLFVAGFIGSPAMNFFRGIIRAEGSRLFFQEGSSEEQNRRRFILRLEDSMNRFLGHCVGKQIVLGMRPEDITISALPNEPRMEEPPREIEARIEVIEPMGSETYLSLSTGLHSFIVRVSAQCRARLNEKVSLTFDLKRAHFFDPITEKALILC